ncbi:MAG: hypothetical protein QOE50_1395 [Sphingomonadales bacterium]|nr:hypothetical protein [Sphingomonadales bacterium]
MSAKRTIRDLLATAAQPAERREARMAWVKEMLAKWREAQREMDDRCTQAVERLSEEAFERLFEAEQAKVDAIMKAVKDAAERDLWPRALYFGCI